jgi:alkylation response protein AidB-like acyl-CoA dehydrogenase
MTVTPLEEHDWDLARASLRRVLEDADTAALATRLEEFGWGELLSREPAAAVAIVFELAGELLASGWLLDEVVARELGAEDSGTGRTGVVYPAPGTTAAAMIDDGQLRVDGVAFAAPDSRDRFVAMAGTSVVTLPAGRLHGVRRPGLDPSLGLHHVHADCATSTADVHVDHDSARVVRATAAGRRALSHELLAMADRMIALGAEHARDREQFGRPIGSFQAVAHHLADAHVASAAGRDVLAEAWRDPGHRTAQLAKHWAGRAARLAARHVQQVLGGIGFTWDHPLHHYVRRTLVLDGTLGSAAEIARELGRQLRHERHIPRLAGLTAIDPVPGKGP